MLADLIPKIAGQFQKEDGDYYPRPSMAGPQRCIRQMVYHGLKFPHNPFPGRAILVFDDSSWHEELTHDWIRRSTYKLHSEQMHVDIPAGLDFLPERTCKTMINGKPCNHIIPAGALAGHIDACFDDLLNNTFHEEHKALNHFTFQYLWKGELPLDNITQTCIYNRGLQLIDPSITRSLLLIKNKNTAAYMEYEIGYDLAKDEAGISRRTSSQGETVEMDEQFPRICGDAFDRFAEVQHYIGSSTLPPRQYHINDDWQCERCRWGQTCWKDYEKEFNELATETMLPNEVADLVRLYKQVGAEKGETEKHYEELKNKIKGIMDELGVREGRAGEYVLRRKLQTRTTYDGSVLPKEWEGKARRTSTSQRLFISKIKEEK